MPIQNQEFWKWPETRWTNPDIALQDAKYITAGIDVGSVSCQAVIMADGEIFAYGNMRAGFDSTVTARKVLQFALESTEMEEHKLDYCVGTGYGRVNIPFADRTITEVACHARGANFIYGSQVKTVLDVGGQDIKVIHCNEKGKAINFLVSDKCATGTGIAIEVFADLLRIPITRIGDMSLRISQETKPLKNTCVVYAKTEAIALLREGVSVEGVLASYFDIVTDRIWSVVERLGVRSEFAVTGGVAKNNGIIERLVSRVGLEPLKTKWDPQIAGAVGAALFGHALCVRGKAKKRRKLGN